MDNLSLNVGKHAQWNLNPPKTAQFDMVVWVQVYNMCIYKYRLLCYFICIYYTQVIIQKTHLYIAQDKSKNK